MTDSTGRLLREAVNAFLIDWVYRFARWTAAAILICLWLTFHPLVVYVF